MPLALDHIFCMVAPDGSAARRLEAAGWSLDSGTEHAGQGTRNRRHAWADCYFELLSVSDASEARTNRLRLDRRADWASSGSSPVGIALRGRLSEADAEDYWCYDALGFPIWVHRDNERAPERPLVFVLAIPENARRTGRPSSGARLRSVHVTAPELARIPAYEGPLVEQDLGPHHLELVAGDGPAITITDALSIRV